MLGKTLRLVLMLGIPLVLLLVFVVKPLISGGGNRLVEGEGLVVVEDRGIVITVDEAERMVNYLGAKQQAYLKESSENMQEFLLAKMTQKVLAAEALSLGLDKNAKAEWGMEEVKRSILSAAVIEEKRLNTEIPGNIEQIAEEYYLANEQDFITDESIEAAHILLRSDAANDAEKKALAEQILAEIEAGLDFSEAAQQYSEEEATASAGGVLGRFGRGQLVPAFETAAFALKDQGDISEVVKTQFGYHIIMLLADNTPGVLRPFEEVKETLVANESAKYMKLILTQYAETFQSNENKTVYVPALEELLETMQEGESDEAAESAENADL